MSGGSKRRKLERCSVGGGKKYHDYIKSVRTQCEDSISLITRWATQTLCEDVFYIRKLRNCLIHISYIIITHTVHFDAHGSNYLFIITMALFTVLVIDEIIKFSKWIISIDDAWSLNYPRHEKSLEVYTLAPYLWKDRLNIICSDEAKFRTCARYRSRRRYVTRRGTNSVA